MVLKRRYDPERSEEVAGVEIVELTATVPGAEVVVEVVEPSVVG